MNESSPAASALGWVLAGVDVSLPLGSIEELIRLIQDSVARGALASCTTENVSRLYGNMESTETMEGVLERTGETLLSLPPQETMWLAIRQRERDVSYRFCRML